FLLVGAVVRALPPTCIGQADTTPAPTDSTTRPTHSYFIDAARLTREGAVRDVADLLMDRVPGLLVVPGSGLTGTGSRIRRRGVQSLVDDLPPLVLVDGLRVDQTEDDYWASMTGPLAPGPLRLSDLSVEDLESVEVVGPAGAAVYGPGAAGGVLLIRTKRGRAGPPRWEARSEEHTSELQSRGHLVCRLLLEKKKKTKKKEKQRKRLINSNARLI